MKKRQVGLRAVRKFRRSKARLIKYFAVFAVILTAVSGVFVPVYFKSVLEARTKAEDAASERRGKFNELMFDLEARAAGFPGEVGIYIKDLLTGQTIEINSTKLLPSASLVKVPIMAAVYQAQKEGKFKLSDKIILKRRHKIRDCSRLFNAKSGRAFMVKDVVERMVTESDNTATNMLVDALGFGYLNTKFMQFGLKDTDLRRGVMDLKWREAGIENYTTAYDMGVILENIYKGALIDKESSEAMLTTLKRQHVNDRIPRFLPDGLVVAHKTGSLKDTISDCGIVFTDEGDFIICVLTADAKNNRIAKKFISNIAVYAYDKCFKKL